MKTRLLAVILFFVSLPGYSQEDLQKERQQFLHTAMESARLQPFLPSPSPNKKNRQLRIAAKLLLQPSAVKKLLLTHNTRIITVAKKPAVITNTQTNPIDPLCVDTSYTKLLGVTNAVLYIEAVTQTMDGGMLVPALMYDSTTLENRTFGMLLKLDEDG